MAAARHCLLFQMHTNRKHAHCTAVESLKRKENSELSRGNMQTCPGHDVMDEWIPQMNESMNTVSEVKSIKLNRRAFAPLTSSVDCSGTAWQSYEWFSVTEPFSHGDHQQLSLSFTSHAHSLSHDVNECFGSSFLVTEVKDWVCVLVEYCWDELNPPWYGGI